MLKPLADAQAMYERHPFAKRARRGKVTPAVGATVNRAYGGPAWPECDRGHRPRTMISPFGGLLGIAGWVRESAEHKENTKPQLVVSTRSPQPNVHCQHGTTPRDSQTS